MRFYPEIVSLFFVFPPKSIFFGKLQTKDLVIGIFTRFYCLFSFSDDLTIGRVSFTNSSEWLLRILQLY